MTESGGGGRKIPLYIITGFLGSGKTTVLNSVLKEQGWRKTGVILNDFGSLNIDVSMLDSDSGIVKSELSGGQIFCSCLSGSFVNSVAEYAGLDIDALIVEASGLAKPNPLLEIIEWADKKSSSAFDFRGMICVIDVQRYNILSEAVNAVKEQIVYSDLLVLNKCDLVSEEQIVDIEKKLQMLKSGVNLIRTEYGRIPSEILNQMEFSADIISRKNSAEYRGWGDSGRPLPVHLIPSAVVSEGKLKCFLEKAGNECFRMKGYVKTSGNGTVLVNCSGSQIDIETDLSDDHAETGIVIIMDQLSPLRENLSDLWNGITGTDSDIIEGNIISEK